MQWGKWNGIDWSGETKEDSTKLTHSGEKEAQKLLEPSRLELGPAARGGACLSPLCDWSPDNFVTTSEKQPLIDSEGHGLGPSDFILCLSLWKLTLEWHFILLPSPKQMVSGQFSELPYSRTSGFQLLSWGALISVWSSILSLPFFPHSPLTNGETSTHNWGGASPSGKEIFERQCHLGERIVIWESESCLYPELVVSALSAQFPCPKNGSDHTSHRIAVLKHEFKNDRK